MKSGLIFIWIGFLSISTSLATSVEDTEAELKALERAHSETDTLKKDFRAALKDALQKGGPQKALSECKIKAPKISQRGEKIKLGRTSHKLRNPNNAPPEWVKPYLEKFLKTETKNIPKSTIIQLSKNHYGYLEPIFVEPLCLNCHGSQLSQGLVDAIHKEYPNDKATGFVVGDLRGLLWVEMSK